MKLAMRLPYHAPGLTGQGLANVARAAEDAGMHSGWVADHIVFPADEITSIATTTKDGKYPRPLDEPTLEAWTTLSYAAAVTSRMKLAVGVSVLPYRSPLLLSKIITTLDILSGGRVMCGAGIGWLKEEFDALGVPFSTRRAQTEDTIDVLRRSWESSPFSYAGEVVSIPNPVHFEPRPSRQIPIILGGHSAPALRRAARIGDGWIGHEILPGKAVEIRAEMMAYAGGALRPGFELVVSRLINPSGIAGADPTRLSAGDTELLDTFTRYEEAGVDVLLCEPTVRSVDAHLRLIEQVHAVGDRWLNTE